LAQDLDLSKMDRRLVDRLVRRGELGEKELDKFLKSLPDLADEAAQVEAKLEPLEAKV